MATTLQQSGILFPDGSAQKSSAYDTMKFAQTFTTSGTWTAPANCFEVQLIMFGGGGAGGSGVQANSGSTVFYNGGGGGGSSAVIDRYRVAVVPSTVYSVTVGASTLASSFGTLVSINPGITGTNATTTASSAGVGVGGAGGAVLTPARAVNTTTYDRSSVNVAVAGNVGSAGTRTTTLANAGGAGANLPIYNYAGATVNNAAATANTGAGGAGGGQGSTAGGAGGSGLVIVQW